MTDPWRTRWQDYYEILQVSCNAEQDTIKWAYNKLANKYHPDKSTGCEARMKLLGEAYRVLGEATARKRYDVDYRGRRAEAASTAGEVPFRQAWEREKQARQKAEAEQRREAQKRRELERELAAARLREQQARAREPVAHQQKSRPRPPQSAAGHFLVNPWVELNLALLEGWLAGQGRRSGRWKRLGDDQPHAGD
jgi:curved DNA-binding protein CbpA